MNILKNTKIILASQSPRRKDLLAQAGFTFEIIPSTIEETITRTIPEEVVKELSSQKAEDVFQQIIDSFGIHRPIEDDLSLLVLGADTIVSFNNQIMGKPSDKKEAASMLHTIQGNTHQVYTGVTMIYHEFSKQTTTVRTFAECTDVTVYPMNDSEIYDYIATGDSLDKAGAYGIQGPFAVHVKKIDGDYNNVVGLPIARLYHELRHL